MMNINLNIDLTFAITNGTSIEEVDKIIKKLRETADDLEKAKALLKPGKKVEVAQSEKTIREDYPGVSIFSTFDAEDKLVKREFHFSNGNKTWQNIHEGRVMNSKRSTGFEKSWEYDSEGRCTHIKDNSGYEARYGYYDHGILISVKEGGKWTNSFIEDRKEMERFIEDMTNLMKTN